jgi:hypothetical protein
MGALLFILVMLAILGWIAWRFIDKKSARNVLVLVGLLFLIVILLFLIVILWALSITF